MEPNEELSELATLEFDVYWDQWLRNIIEEPYTPDQLKAFYASETKRQKVAMAYEIRDANMMKGFREDYRKQNENNKTKLDKGYSETFEPGGWKSGTKK